MRKDIQRQMGQPPKQKLAVTPDVLLALYAHLDLKSSFLHVFWAACLAAFHAFLRKSSLLPAGNRRDKRYLCHRDITFMADKDSVMLTIRHNKTSQFGQRVPIIPFSAHPRHELCPIQALQDMLHRLYPPLPHLIHPLFPMSARMGWWTP